MKRRVGDKKYNQWGCESFYRSEVTLRSEFLSPPMAGINMPIYGKGPCLAQ